MIVRHKLHTDLDFTDSHIYYVIGIAGLYWGQYGARELWLTGVREHGHTTNPDVRRQFHWLPDGTCRAVDFRTHNIIGDKHALVKLLSRTLGPEYDVILEEEGLPEEHIHVQWDVERPGTVI